MASVTMWSDLPIDLLQRVCKKLFVINDYAAFGVVCSNWRSALLLCHHKHMPPQVPLLVLPDISGEHTAFHSPDFRKQVLPTKQPVFILCGSNYGWLITRVPALYLSDNNDTLPRPIKKVLLYTNNTLHLLNPFVSVNNVINIPIPDTDKRIRKIIFSNDPSHTTNYQVMAIHYEPGVSKSGVSFFRPGNTSWTCIDYHEQNPNEYFLDLTYYEDKLYGVTFDYDSNEEWPRFLVSCNTNSTPPSMTRVAQLTFTTSLLYLVVSAGELLCVEWKSASDLKDTRFRVLKFETSKQYEMIELENLRGHAIFVTLEFSGVSILASDFPNCQPDHIYFSSTGQRSGVFNFMDKTVQSFELPDFNKKKPIWIQPRLNLPTNTTTAKESPSS